MSKLSKMKGQTKLEKLKSGERQDLADVQPESDFHKRVEQTRKEKDAEQELVRLTVSVQRRQQRALVRLAKKMGEKQDKIVSVSEAIRAVLAGEEKL